MSDQKAIRDDQYGLNVAEYWQGRALALKAETERLRAENLSLVDAMRDARALLHKPRPRAMAAAALLGDVLTTRMLAMLPELGDDDCSQCGPVGGDADCPRCNP